MLKGLVNKLDSSVAKVEVVSGISRRKMLYAIGITLALLAMLLPFFFQPTPYRTIKAGSASVRLEVAKTVATREKGLGGRVSMPANQGMLFVFDKPGVECFWMKNMQFPLDMIWLSADKKVVFVEQNVLPISYKTQTQYCPPTPANYVIELNANQAAKLGIYLGQTLNF